MWELDLDWVGFGCELAWPDTLAVNKRQDFFFIKCILQGVRLEQPHVRVKLDTQKEFTRKLEIQCIVRPSTIHHNYQ